MSASHRLTNCTSCWKRRWLLDARALIQNKTPADDAGVLFWMDSLLRRQNCSQLLSPLAVLLIGAASLAALVDFAATRPGAISMVRTAGLGVRRTSSSLKTLTTLVSVLA